MLPPLLRYAKKTILPALAFLLFLPPVAFAEGYLSVGGGAGGNAEAANLTLEFGAMLTGKERKRLVAVGVGFIFNGDSIPSDTLDYPVPHSNYTSLGERRDGNELVVVAKFGIEVVKKTGAFVFALGGFSDSHEVEIARSNVTGWYYEQSSSDQYYGVFGGGVGFYPPNSPVSFSVEYDNRRGVTGSVGYHF